MSDMPQVTITSVDGDSGINAIYIYGGSFAGGTNIHDSTGLGILVNRDNVVGQFYYCNTKQECEVLKSEFQIDSPQDAPKEAVLKDGTHILSYPVTDDGESIAIPQFIATLEAATKDNTAWAPEGLRNDLFDFHPSVLNATKEYYANYVKMRNRQVDTDEDIVEIKPNPNKKGGDSFRGI